MTIQKAKEIIISYLKNVVGIVDHKKVDKYLASPEAAALLSGEDWKEDGLKWINASKELPALEKVVFIKDNIGLERLGNFYENDEGGHNLYIQPNGSHDGFTVNGENDNFSHYNWLYDHN